MNFIHQASCALQGGGSSHKLYRATLPQVRVADPRIGCGHLLKLVNEWQLMRSLYKRCLQGDHTAAGPPCLFEVRRVFGDVKEMAPSKDEETFIVFALAPFQVHSSQSTMISQRKNS